MDTAQWPQEIVTNTCPKPPLIGASAAEKKPRPQKAQALNCPRCNSTNTKFCYYNNYSLTQPRYFCKTCRRYWTEGGSLRNIPVGGGTRKNKRSAPSSSTSKKLPDLITPQSSLHNHNGQDLNLGFSPTQLVQVPNVENTIKNNTFSTNNGAACPELSSLELISGISSRGFASFMSMPHDPSTVYSGFPMQEFRPTLNFSLDGLGSSNNGYGVQEGTTTSTSERILFPFDDPKQVPSSADQQSKVHGDSAGYWTGMLGGAGSW